jgi:hypothetical protein
VDAGVRWATVIAAAAEHGLAPLDGSSPGVGVVGYTLGGGVGALARQYGFAADHVRSFELVTADGDDLHVSPARHPDLYWAVLGAPGSFGVVTSLEFDLVPVRTLYGGGLRFPAEQAHVVLDAFRAWTADLPDATTASIALRPGPTGRRVVQLRFAHVGDSETGRDVLSPMRACAPVLLDSVDEMPYSTVADIFADPCAPAPAYRAGVFLNGLDAAAVDAVLAAAASSPLPSRAAVEVRHLGGAVGRVPVHPNCVGGRDADFVLGVVAPQHPHLARTAQARCREVIDAVAPWSAEVLPINYLHGDVTPASAQRAWSPGDLTRLRRLKRDHDPGNTFRVGPTVQP